MAKHRNPSSRLRPYLHTVSPSLSACLSFKVHRGIISLTLYTKLKESGESPLYLHFLMSIRYALTHFPLILQDMVVRLFCSLLYYSVGVLFMLCLFSWDTSLYTAFLEALKSCICFFFNCSCPSKRSRSLKRLWLHVACVCK